MFDNPGPAESRPVVAGVGCSSAATSAEITTLVSAALGQCRGRLVALGTALRRADHPGLLRAAMDLGVPLRVIELPGPEVAEPVAGSVGQLVLVKQKSAHATCALARVAEGFDPARWGQPASRTDRASSTLATSGAGS